MIKRGLQCVMLAALAASCGGEEQQGASFQPGLDAGVDVGEDEPDACGQACDEDVPERPDEGCSEDGECAEGELCHEDQCQPGCRSDAACAEGLICLDLSCVEGCRNPADCEPGFTCIANQCEVEPCAFDEECGSGSRCREERCVEIGATECASDMDCGLRWRCSPVTGVCIDSFCALDGDCPDIAWCRDGLCEPRAALLGPVSLVRQQVPGPSDHLWTHRDNDAATYGSGGGLIDIDGDLDLDLFLGAYVDDTLDVPCLYENLSTPGELRFEPVEGLCDRSMGNVSSAWGIDLEGEGVESLLLLGRRTVRLLRPGDAPIELLDTLPEGDYRRLCTAGAAHAQDFDHDGLLDLLIGCQLPSGVIEQLRQVDFPNILFRQIAPGVFDPEDSPLQDELADRGNSLALGALDIDEDGLTDLLVTNDIWLGDLADPDRRLTPGGIVRRCSPEQGCLTELLPFGRRSRAFGAFMGAGNVSVDTRGEHLYVTDAGGNRFVGYDDALDPVDIATELGLEVAFDGMILLFAWSVIVDDFDRNGLDDFLFTQGPVPVVGSTPDHYEKHYDALFVQSAGGEFSMMRDEAGLTPHTMEEARSEEKVFSSRGAVKADLDADGRLDIIIAGLEGSPLIYSEDPQGDDLPRCTLVPRPRVVPARGWGYALAPTDTDDWRRRDVQAQMRFGASPWVLSSLNAGRLRFPSGAIVPFDCEGTPGPVEIVEPDWLQVSREGQTLTIALDAPWLPPTVEVEVALPPEPDAPSVLIDAQEEGPVWRSELPEGADAVMLCLNGRWIARWWPL